MEQRTVPSEVTATPPSMPALHLSETQANVELTSPVAILPSDTASVEAQSAELSLLARRTQQRTDRTMWAIPAFYCVMTALYLLARFWLGEERSTTILSSPLAYIPLALVWVGATGIMLRSSDRPRKQMREMARTLSESGSLHAAGALLDTFQQEDQKTHQIAKEGLIGILPSFQSSDADLLTTAHRTVLVRQLNLPLLNIAGGGPSAQAAYQRNVEFRIAIRKALAQVGDESALPVVQRLAQGEAKSDGQRRIQVAAAACLPSLLMRVEQQRSHQTLLRASNATASEPETLLRSASGGSSESRPEQLLKPSSPDP